MYRVRYALCIRTSAPRQFDIDDSNPRLCTHTQMFHPPHAFPGHAFGSPMSCDGRWRCTRLVQARIWQYMQGTPASTCLHRLRLPAMPIMCPGWRAYTAAGWSTVMYTCEANMALCVRGQRGVCVRGPGSSARVVIAPGF